MKNMGKAIILSTGLLIAGAEVSLLPHGINHAEAASVSVKFSKTSFQTTANLNLRTGASTKHKVIKTIPKGATVTSSEKNGTWYKVSYTYKSKGKNVTKTGWVSGSYLKKKAASAIAKQNAASSKSTSVSVKFSKTEYQTKANLNMRTGASTKNKVIITIPKGKTVSSTEKINNWYKVSYTYKSKGKNVTKTGWVSGTHLKKKASASSTQQSAAPSKSTSASVKFSKTEYQTISALNMRTGAGTKNKIIATIPKGKKVASAERIGNWYKVSYTYKSKGKNVTKTGWVSGSYLKKLASNTTKNPAPDKNDAVTVKFTKTNYQTTANLNMREEASTKTKVLATIPKGYIVPSSEKDGNWYKVSYTYKSKGKNVTKTGWVSGSYLKEYYKYTKISKKYIFTKGNVNLYSAPDTKKKAVKSLAKDTGMETVQSVVNSIGQTWYEVNVDGKVSYISAGDINTFAFKTISKTEYIAQKDSYVYKLYGKDYAKLIKIPKGTIVSSVKSIGSWYGVSFNGKSGYVYAGDFTEYQAPVKEEAIQPPANTIAEEKIADKEFVVTANLNLRKSNNTSSDILITIPKDTKVVATYKTANNWYKITYKDKTGYVSGTYLKEVEKIETPPKEDAVEPPANTIAEEKIADKEFVVTVNLNLRESNNTSSAALITIPKDTKVVPTHKTANNWYKITYKDKTGYVSGTYLKEAEKTETPPKEEITEVKLSEKTYLINADLNLREKADTASAILTTIPKGKIVIPTHKTSNNWYKIIYNGKTGYVSGTYIQQVKTGDPLDSRNSYQFIDLRTQSPVTAQQINNYIAYYVKITGKTSVLTNKGQVFIDVGRKYGINAQYLAAHAIHESAFGTSSLALGKNNLFGFGAFDATPYVGGYRFQDIESSIDYIAREIKSTYMNPSNWKYKGAYLGFTTKTTGNTRIDSSSEGMNFYYATDENWGKGIARHMENMLAYDQSYYDKAAVNTSIPSRPGIPAGGDLFPNGIQAKANRDITLHSKLGTKDYVKVIKKGSAFFIKEKLNNYWVRVQVDGQEFWTSDIKFDVYKSYITVQNLGRVTTALNIRPEPSTSKAPIGFLAYNDYVSIVVQKDGTLSKDSTKSWYEIELANGSKGWVSAKYITRELD